MPPQQHLYNGLARPADYSIFVWEVSNPPAGAEPKKSFFCVQEDELLSAANGLLTEEGQTHPVVLSHNDLNVTTIASSGGSIGGER